MTLTVREVEAARPGARVYRLYDSGGMYLEVRPSGARLWILRYRYQGREKRISLGPYPEVSLRAAREARDEARALLRQGIDPSAHRRAQRRTGAEQATVEALAREWYETWRQGRAEKTIRTTDYYLRRIIIPALGATPIVELTPQAILDMVLPLVRREAIETAHRVVQRLSMICRYAIRTGRLQMDPAAHLSEALPVVRERHHPAIIDPAEWGALLRAIWSYEGHAVVRAALRMAPLVVVRPGELRGAEWSEIDFDTATWVIPASRMKMRQDHVVPLARQVVEILRELQPITGDGRYVFPSVRSRERPISDMTLNAALRRLGYSSDEVVVHGFRASFRTLGDEVLGFRVDLLEHQLAHQVRDPLGRAYNRTSFLSERREMMQRWADWCEEVMRSAPAAGDRLRSVARPQGG